MGESVNVAAISGSLRKGSYNTAALRALQAVAGDRFEMDLITLENVPPFNEDVEARGWPDPVARLRDRVVAADGVIFATPEYNYSVAGVLKNAIDWLSRPPQKGPIYGKPAAIIGATPSTVGTARAQAHLRQIAYYNAMPLLPTDEVLISRADAKFADDGTLTDADTRKFLTAFAVAFERWIAFNRATKTTER